MKQSLLLQPVSLFPMTMMIRSSELELCLRGRFSPLPIFYATFTLLCTIFWDFQQHMAGFDNQLLKP
jgi:hypothetical protein